MRPVALVPCDTAVWSFGGRLTGENQTARRRNSSCALLFTTNPTCAWDWIRVCRVIIRRLAAQAVTTETWFRSQAIPYETHVGQSGTGSVHSPSCFVSPYQCSIFIFHSSTIDAISSQKLKASLNKTLNSRSLKYDLKSKLTTALVRWRSSENASSTCLNLAVSVYQL